MYSVKIDGDFRLFFIFGFLLAVFALLIGFFDTLDRALEAQEAHNRLSVYCQQAGHIETFCATLKEGD